MRSSNTTGMTFTSPTLCASTCTVLQYRHWKPSRFSLSVQFIFKCMAICTQGCGGCVRTFPIDHVRAPRISYCSTLAASSFLYFSSQRASTYIIEPNPLLPLCEVADSRLASYTSSPSLTYCFFLLFLLQVAKSKRSEPKQTRTSEPQSGGKPRYLWSLVEKKTFHSPRRRFCLPPSTSVRSEQAGATTPAAVCTVHQAQAPQGRSRFR